ncbi:MAG: stage III sporulation protein AB [Ruminococcus sp.]|nr:stage III sporulation protein AB [Ruminococcus sp.]
MSGMVLVGSGLVILFGAAAGRACGEYVMARCRAAEAAADMLESMLLMLCYEQPTVDEMLSRITPLTGNAPAFMRSACGGRQALLDSLREDCGEMYEPDRIRLETLVRELGSADKQSEQQRISSALEYFRGRSKALRPKAEVSSRLCRSLGIIGGIFLVVLLV